MFNYLLRLGWGHGDDEIISREQAIEWFDLDHVGKSPSRFDFKKLENLNGHYIREADDARLAELVAPRLGLAAERTALLVRAMPELKARAHTLNELADGARVPVRHAAARHRRGGGRAAHRRSPRACSPRLHAALAALADWDAGVARGAIREVAESSGVKLGKLAQPLRAALTGRTTSPGIFDVLALLGRDESLARIADQSGAERMTDKTVDADDRRAGISISRCSTARSVPTWSISASSTARPACSPTIPGFTSTASCESAITYIDGEKGILLHRGYPIDQLAEHSTFMEVAYLLLHGELPTQTELDDFTYTISRHTMVHEQLATFYRGFRRDAHPMAIMCGVVGALSAFYHDSTDITDPEQRMIASHRLIAKMPTIAAMAYKYSLGQPFLYPAEQPQLHRQFPAHDLRRPGRAL